MAAVVIVAAATYFGSASVAAVAYAAYQVYSLSRANRGRDTEGPRLGDEAVLNSSYGTGIPIVAGTKEISGNVIWMTPRREVAISTEVGGKGGGSSTSTTYKYYLDAAILLGEGEAAGIRKMKFSGELKYNVSDDASSETVMASALNAAAVRFYPGTETQEADPLIVSHEGADAPAYRGYCYVVFESIDVTNYGGTLPQITAELVMAGSEALTVAITSGAAFGTSALIASAAPVLGRNGSVWILGSVSNTAVRANFYASSIQGSYTRALWGYIPSGITPSGECFYGNYGGYVGILHDDGSVTEYTSAPAILGVNGGISFISSTEGFGQGDGSSTQNLYRFVLNNTDMTVTETLLSSARSVILFRNACGIAGRCYCYGDTTFSHDVGYIEDDSNSKVLLFTGTAYSSGGLLVSSDGYLWMARSGASTNVEKRSADGTLIGSVVIPSGTVSKIFEAPDGTIWAWVSSGAIYGIHPATLDIFKTSVNTGTKTPLGFTEDGRLVMYSSSAGTYYFHEMEPLPRVSVGTASLDTFIEEHCERAGLSSGDLDLSELSGDTIEGYSVTRGTVRSHLEPFQAPFVFDVVESDYKLKFKKRGSASVVSIPEEDLGAHFDGEDAPANVSVVRRLETELPREVAVQYIDRESGYGIGSQYARRLTGQSSESQNVDIPMVLTADRAAEIAQMLLHNQWAERTGVNLSLSQKYAYLEPADVITVTASGIEYTLRILEINQDRGLLKLKTVTEDFEVYDPVASGAPLPDAADSIVVGGPTVLRILDIPLLRDADDGAGFYAAAAGYYDGWAGAELWMSRDDGVTWEPTTTTFLEPSVMGSALTALPNFLGGNVFDESSTVQVQVFGGELSSTTAALVLSGSNAAYLGGEIIQFKNATLVSPGKYTLTGLLRGRKGTEQYMSTHAVGDSFVFLSTGTTKRVSLETSDIGTTIQYKAVTLGQNLAEAVAVPFTPAGNGLEPLSSVQPGVGRTAAASYDIVIKWVPRGRLSAEWRDYVDVPTGETTEAYEVDIYTNSTYGTVKRTITGLSTPTCTYTSAQQVTDFGSNQATVYFDIFKVSAATGRGFKLRGQG